MLSQEQSAEDLAGHRDDEAMATVAGTSNWKSSTDSSSAFGSSGCQRTRLASSVTRRPLTQLSRPSLHPYWRQRCTSEHGPFNGWVAGGGGGSAAAQYRSCGELGSFVESLQSANDASSFHRPPHRTRGRASQLTTVNPLQRKDIFYGGSVVSLRGSSTMFGGLHGRPSVELADVELPAPVQSTTAAGESTPTRWRCGAGGERFSTLLVMLDVSLFGNRAFLVICASCVFIQLGYFVPVVFITPYTQTLRLTKSDAALFLSVVGHYHVFTVERKRSSYVPLASAAW